MENISQLRKITLSHNRTLPSITSLDDLELRLLLWAVTLILFTVQGGVSSAFVLFNMGVINLDLRKSVLSRPHLKASLGLKRHLRRCQLFHIEER